MPPTVTLSSDAMSDAPAARAGLSLGRRFLVHLVRQVEYGQLLFRLPSGETIHRTGPRPGPSASLVLHRWRAVRRGLLGGDIGFAEAYMDGDWSTPDLTSLIEVVARNHATLVPALDGSRVARLMHRLLHLLRSNTKRGSRRNIPAHYDLGNAFYAAWLDEGMTYSSGFYEDSETTLEQAQIAKQDLVMDALALTGGEHVLETGCGWAGLAERLAFERGCHVVGLTLSPAQLEHARTRLPGCRVPGPLSSGPPTGTVELRRRDYRDMDGTFDRVVSIEMLEAVGKEYWPTYFATVHDRLRPGGVAVIQVITMAEERYAAYEHGTDFIQRHIFPGGMLPSDSVMRAQIDAAGMVLDGVHNFGASYARTLADWQARFQRAWPRLRTMGFDERFKRKWEYYLSYCEAGFLAGALDVGLYRMHRPG
jgi:cyclopropane-fatty-acyl-phospholipid synthase